MTNVPTIEKRNHRRLDRRIGKVTHVVSRMQRGASLLLQHTRRGRVWRLSTGYEVSDEVAREVLTRAGVVGVGDALFHDTLSQTYQWVEEENAT
jgi:hypothetical protein